MNTTLALQVLLGGGMWSAKSKKKFKKKYFISREQFVRMEAPSLKVRIMGWIIVITVIPR